MNEKDIPLHLEGMMLAISRIKAIYAEIDFETLEHDWRYQSILERQIEIVSEASRKLTDVEKSLTGDVNWRAIAGIGNILRHEYRKIDLRILWDIAENQLPRLESAILALMARHPHYKA
jgi:uncharacterized protein with HEPN domain